MLRNSVLTLLGLGLLAGCSLEGDALVTTTLQVSNEATASVFTLSYEISDAMTPSGSYTLGLEQSELATGEQDSLNIKTALGAQVHLRIVVDTEGTERTHVFDPQAISKEPYAVLNFRHLQDAVSGDYHFEIDYNL